MIDLLKIMECDGITPDDSMVFATLGTGRLKEWIAENPGHRENFAKHLEEQARLCRETLPPFELPKEKETAGV